MLARLVVAALLAGLLAASAAQARAQETRVIEVVSVELELVVKDTKPNEDIFNCSPKNLYALKTDADDITTLADVGQDIKNMK